MKDSAVLLSENTFSLFFKTDRTRPFRGHFFKAFHQHDYGFDLQDMSEYVYLSLDIYE